MRACLCLIQHAMPECGPPDDHIINLLSLCIFFVVHFRWPMQTLLRAYLVGAGVFEFGMIHQLLKNGLHRTNPIFKGQPPSPSMDRVHVWVAAVLAVLRLVLAADFDNSTLRWGLLLVHSLELAYFANEIRSMGVNQGNSVSTGSGNTEDDADPAGKRKKSSVPTAQNHNQKGVLSLAVDAFLRGWSRLGLDGQLFFIPLVLQAAWLLPFH